jgi:hypothetical protein
MAGPGAGEHWYGTPSPSPRAAAWSTCFGSAPGVPLEETVALPGTAVPRDGYLVPSGAPGFGLEVTLDWLERVAVR